MNTLLALASLVAVTVAAPSGILGGTVLAGPGLVTNVGLGGLGLGGLGLSGVGLSGVGLGGVGLGGLGVGGLGLGLKGGILAAPAVSSVIAGPGLVGLGGLGAVTNGGGTIGVSGVGATIAGPPTAPVVIAGPSGKIAADGLWGPTANIGGGAWGKGW